MSVKQFNVPDIGVIAVYKRKGTKQLSIRFSGNQLKVTQPAWMPYQTGVTFALTHKKWILEHLPTSAQTIEIKDGNRYGKEHILRIIQSAETRTRITKTEILIYCPSSSGVIRPEYISLAKKAIYRALKKEATDLLDKRLAMHAANHQFKYKKVSFKSMKSRWGSCNSNREITLNIYLLMLPWNLIDYVIFHELSHTLHLNHSAAFWEQVHTHIPNYKQLRKELKQMQTSVMALR